MQRGVGIGDAGVPRSDPAHRPPSRWSWFVDRPITDSGVGGHGSRTSSRRSVIADRIRARGSPPIGDVIPSGELGAVLGPGVQDVVDRRADAAGRGPIQCRYTVRHPRLDPRRHHHEGCRRRGWSGPPARGEDPRYAWASNLRGGLDLRPGRLIARYTEPALVRGGPQRVSNPSRAVS